VAVGCAVAARGVIPWAVFCCLFCWCSEVSLFFLLSMCIRKTLLYSWRATKSGAVAASTPLSKTTGTTLVTISILC
jgi:hypothetical protein